MYDVYTDSKRDDYYSVEALMKNKREVTLMAPKAAIPEEIMKGKRKPEFSISKVLKAGTIVMAVGLISAVVAIVKDGDEEL